MSLTRRQYRIVEEAKQSFISKRVQLLRGKTITLPSTGQRREEGFRPEGDSPRGLAGGILVGHMDFNKKKERPAKGWDLFGGELNDDINERLGEEEREGLKFVIKQARGGHDREDRPRTEAAHKHSSSAGKPNNQKKSTFKVGKSWKTLKQEPHSAQPLTSSAFSRKLSAPQQLQRSYSSANRRIQSRTLREDKIKEETVKKSNNNQKERLFAKTNTIVDSPESPKKEKPGMAGMTQVGFDNVRSIEFLLENASRGMMDQKFGKLMTRVNKTSTSAHKTNFSEDLRNTKSLTNQIKGSRLGKLSGMSRGKKLWLKGGLAAAFISSDHIKKMKKIEHFLGNQYLF